MTLSVADSSPSPSKTELQANMKSLVNHLLSFDLKQQRPWLIPLWSLSVVIGVLGALKPVDSTLSILHGALVLIACILCIACIISAIHAHVLSESNAWWPTRPIHRRELLHVKLRFAFVYALLPLFIALTVGWIASGFTFPQLLAAMCEYGLYLATGVAVIGAAVTLGGSRQRACVVIAVCVGGTMLWFLLLSQIQYRLHLLRPMRSDIGAAESSLMLAVVILLIGALFTWVRFTLKGELVKSGAGLVIGLLLIGPLNMLRPVNFLSRGSTQTNAQLGVITGRVAPGAQAPGEHLLYSHFLASDLPTNSMIYVENLSAEFSTPDRQVQVDVHHAASRYETLAKQLKHHYAEADLLDALRGQYPAETRWSGDWSANHRDSLPVRSTYPKQLRTPTEKGTFQGQLKYSVVDFERIVDLPLRQGARGAKHGVQIAVTLAAEQNNEIDIRVAESTPKLTLSAEDATSTRHRSGSRCIFLIHHPESGESFLIKDRGIGRRTSPSIFDCRRTANVTLSLPFSRLREALTGTTEGNWADGLRLHAYLPRRLGQGKYRFSEKDYVYLSNRRDQRRGSRVATTGEWPGAENAEAARDFIRQFMREGRNLSSREMTARRKKLEAIGAPVVPFILEALPVDTSTFYNYGQSVLRRFITKEHLPQLRKTLPLDPKLATVVRSKRWGADFVDVLEKMAASRDRPMPDDTLLLLVEHASQKHYADIAWHAERASSERLFPLLKKLPDFPYEPTIRRAWENSRVDIVQPDRIATFAAGFGVKDALHVLIRRLTNQHLTDRQRKSIWEEFEKHIAHPGDHEAKESWLLKNAESLQWSAQTQQWIAG
jgi:hypothetical protein